jgi:hypothetical protein
MSAGTKIERKTEVAIAALLTEPTHAAAAAKAGIGEATLQRWLRNPNFLSKYRIARRSIVEAAVGHVQQASAQAVDVLRRNLNCGNPSVEVRAALAILDKAMVGVELIDVTTRLEEIERAFREKSGSATSRWSGAEP